MVNFLKVGYVLLKEDRKKVLEIKTHKREEEPTKLNLASQAVVRILSVETCWMQT